MKSNHYVFLTLGISAAMASGCSGLKDFQGTLKERFKGGADKAASIVSSKDTASKITYPTMGAIERLDPALDLLLLPDVKIERLAAGFEWSEGPVWVPRDKCVLFSDIPNNVINRWKEGEGISEFMKPSGYSGNWKRGGEPGSNGLMLDRNGRLTLCQHGDRRVVRREGNGSLTVLAEFYKNYRFNSPNDLVYHSNGDLYFTDPPYGLEGGVDDPVKELIYQGVYRVDMQGRVTLLTKEMTRPNGIAFSPDEKTLYVANSDPKDAVWMAFDVQEDGTIANGRVLFDSTQWVEQKKGLPDGMAVDIAGNLWATGPGGVLILTPEGKHLGTIDTDEATANCCFGDDGSVLYITADMYFCRIRTTTRGLGF